MLMCDVKATCCTVHNEPDWGGGGGDGGRKWSPLCATCACTHVWTEPTRNDSLFICALAQSRSCFKHFRRWWPVLVEQLCLLFEISALSISWHGRRRLQEVASLRSRRNCPTALHLVAKRSQASSRTSTFVVKVPL